LNALAALVIARGRGIGREALQQALETFAACGVAWM